MRSLPIHDVQKILRSRNPKTIVIFILLIGLAYWFQSGRSGVDPAGEGESVVRGRFAGTCVKVIDGDTIEVSPASGEVIRIRLLGVDCMETHNEEKMEEQALRLGRTSREIQWLGEKAREETRDFVLNMPVEWEIPEGTPGRDPYNRVLAYVEVEGQDVGEQLLRDGLAELRRDRHPRAARYRDSARPLRW